MAVKFFMFKGVVTGRILGLEHGSRVRSYSTGELGRSKRFERNCWLRGFGFGVRNSRGTPNSGAICVGLEVSCRT